MTNEELNGLKIKKNRIELLIKDLQELEVKARAKEEALRKTALTATIAGGIGHFFGYFIHPLFIAATLTAMLATVAPCGIMMFIQQDKADKYEEMIKSYKAQLDELKNQIEFSAEAIFDLSNNIQKKNNTNNTR